MHHVLQLFPGSTPTLGCKLILIFVHYVNKKLGNKAIHLYKGFRVTF